MIVVFRPLRMKDSAQVLAWRNSPEVSAHMYTDHVIGPSEHARWLTGVLAATDRQDWIIEVDGAPAGLANIVRINSTAQRCELGHYIAEPALRSRGVGACVEYILLQHVFETLKLNKLWCEVLADNERAWRLHLNFGFHEEARFRDHVWKNGRFQDVLGLGIIDYEWAAARAECEARLIARGIDPGCLTVRAD